MGRPCFCLAHGESNTVIKSNDAYNSCTSLIVTSVNVFKVFEL